MPYRGRFRGVDLSALKPPEPPALQYDAFADPEQPFNYEQGWREYIIVPGSATNADLRFTVPGDRWLRPIYAHVQLVTDANVANRSVYIDLGDGQGNAIGRAIGSQTQAASTTRDWWFSPTLPVSLTDASSGNILNPLPDIIINPSGKFNYRVANRQVGDVLSLATIYGIYYPNRPRRVARRHPFRVV